MGQTWNSLSGHDRANVDEWLSVVLPLTEAANRQSIALTAAYIARSLDRPPEGVDVPAVLADLRGGVPAEEVYRRPFVDYWSALKSNNPYDVALLKGLNRATSTAATDVQLAMRATANAVETPYGYQRVADGGACEFCQKVDGAYVKSATAMALHNNCGCSLEPLTAPHRLAAHLPDGVAVHSHGELGAVLTSPEHSFTGPSGLT